MNRGAFLLMTEDYQPIWETRRGSVVESVHFGAIAVVDASGRLLASYGNPYLVTFLRSSAKPLQALPFIELGGDQVYHLTSKEIAILCASHVGTEEHVAVVKAIQEKIGVQESDLLCGIQPPLDSATAERLRARGEAFTPNHHNCSGKHSGMLAHARMRGLPISDYIHPQHPVQQTIREYLAAMCALPPERIAVGVDGCSAPTFAVPLYNAALAFARLCDPRGLAVERVMACKRITQSMLAYPQMVSGEGRFDTCLMQVGDGRFLSKGGAEGYQAIGLMPGVLAPDSPGVGIAFKVSDGDSAGRVRPAVALEILRQLGVLTEQDLGSLANFGPSQVVQNWRKRIVGESRPNFVLQRSPES